jgi:hypothetical protein
MSNARTEFEKALEAMDLSPLTDPTVVHWVQKGWVAGWQARGQAEPLTDERKQLTRLYLSAQDVCACAGHNGSIQGRDDRVSRLMDALAAIDGGSQDGAPEWMQEAIAAWSAAKFFGLKPGIERKITTPTGEADSCPKKDTDFGHSTERPL